MVYLTKFKSLDVALQAAKRLEKETGEYHFVVRSVLFGVWEITDRAPLMGEWYDSDGIKHGG